MAWVVNGALVPPYDVSIGHSSPVTQRATGLGDNPMGHKVARAVVFTRVHYRGYTADASGNLTVELRKNGATIPGTSATIAAANQVAGAAVTGSWALAAGDVLTVQVTAIGATAGKGLVADLTGTLS